MWLYTITTKMVGAVTKSICIFISTAAVLCLFTLLSILIHFFSVDSPSVPQFWSTFSQWIIHRWPHPQQMRTRAKTNAGESKIKKGIFTKRIIINCHATFSAYNKTYISKLETSQFLSFQRSGYDSSLACQCNSFCPQYNNCCSDYAQLCAGSRSIWSTMW